MDYLKLKYKLSEDNSILVNLKNRYNSIVPNKYRLKAIPYEELFGIEPELFYFWLVYLFQDDMDFSNYGIKWQLDHIRPVSVCNYSLTSDLKDTFSFYNIMPLYSQENILKSNKRDFELENRREKLVKLFYSDIDNWYKNKSPDMPRLLNHIDNIPLSKLQGPHSLIVDFCNSQR